MSWIVTVAAIFILLLIFFIFFFLISLDGNKIKNQITTETQENQIHINLLNFLRTPIDGKENVQDIIGYAVLEETEEEKEQKEIKYSLPPSYSEPLKLFNEILLEHYSPDCVSLKLDVTDVNNEILRTRYLGFCNMKDFSSSVIVPLKEPGLLLKITAITGKASSLSSTKWCLKQYPPDGKWKCSDYYEGITSCEGVVYANLGDCQKGAIKTNERDDYQDVVPGDIYDEIEEEKEEADYWVLCESTYQPEFGTTCKCQIPTNKNNPCDSHYIQIGEKYDSEDDCIEAAKKIQEESQDNMENSCMGIENEPIFSR